jgi:hypothetical protein
LNVLIGVLTCWFIYHIGKALAGRQVGLMACLAACLYKPFIFYSIVPLKDMLGVCLFAMAVYCFLTVLDVMPGRNASSGERQGKTLDPWLALRVSALGLAVGLLINVRPNAGILLPFILLLIAWYACRDRIPLKRLSFIVLLYMAGLFAAVSPFVIRNYLTAGEMALTTTQGGYHLYLGNNLLNPDPYYRPVPFALASPFEQGAQFAIEASRRAGVRLTKAEASTFWTKEVIHMAVSEPALFTRKLAQKTLVFFNRFEACDHYDIPFISSFVRFFKLPFPDFGLILPLGMAGMILSGFRQRGARALDVIFGL